MPMYIFQCYSLNSSYLFLPLLVVLAVIFMVCIDLYCNCCLLACLKPQPFSSLLFQYLCWASHSAWHVKKVGRPMTYAPN